MTNEIKKAFEKVRALPKWVPSPEYMAAVRAAAGGNREAAAWDCASPEKRAKMRSDLNPAKRWYEQKAWAGSPLTTAPIGAY
jgi:hypothetical protein